MLAKSKLKITEILISKVLIDLNITHYKFVLTNNVLKEFYDMKKESKNSNNKEKFKLYAKQCYLIVQSVEKNTESTCRKVVRTKTEE